MSIYVTKSSMPDITDYIEEIRPIFESHVLTNMGPIYKKMQHELIDYLGVKHLSLFANGHLALEMAIQALGLKKMGEQLGGGEVITTPFTFVSTTHAIVRNNLKPIFCDIRRSDYTMDPDKIEELITDKTVAIIPVHVYGNICDVNKIDMIAKKYGVKVIYDAAHAFGTTYRGIGIGNFGDASMFSFHATKVFNTIEGGAVSFSDEKYRMPLHELKNFGIHNAEDVDAIGSNAKMNEFSAAMGICNLRRMDVCIQKRKAVYEKYYERLSGIEGLVLCKEQKSVKSNYAYMPFYFDESIFGKSRDEVLETLKQNDIFARKYFYPAVNDMHCYEMYKNQKTPIAHDVSLHILTLPMYEDLELQDVDRICDIILE